MEYLKFLKKYRDADNLKKRLRKIWRRYGISGNRMRGNILAFVNTLNRYDIVPTFPTTARVLINHRKYFRSFSPEEVEFAIHGYYHQDYTMLPPQERKEQLMRAYFAFQESDIPVQGFRFPYLRVNQDALMALNELPLEYDSSFPFWWQVPMGSDNPASQVLQKMEAQYTPFSPEDKLLLPYFIGKIVEIPVSLPDDDILVDRVSGLSLQEIFRAWQTILKRSMARGDLFVLQLHPERFELLKEPLTWLLEEVQAVRTNIWVAPLREISRWWKTRRQMKIEYKILDSRRIKLSIKRPIDLEYSCLNYHGELNIEIRGMVKSEFNYEEIIFPVKEIPLVAVGNGISDKFKELLFKAGFPYLENPPEKERFSVYWEKDPPLNSEVSWLKDFLEGLTRPLLRICAWPRQYRSAFAVTGDIDAITVQDFLSRVYGR